MIFKKDYFVLLPSDYYESTVLRKDVVESCRDYRDEEPCIQYKYPSVEKFSPILIPEFGSDETSFDLRTTKEFNQSEPLLVSRLAYDHTIVKNLIFPSPDNYVLLIDFLNLNDDGQEIQVEVNHMESNRRQIGNVYAYKCNLTVLCREVILSRDFNEPLQIEGQNSASVTLRSNKEILVHRITLIQTNKFDLNYIKMSPYCIISKSVCKPLVYKPFYNTKIELDSDENSIRPYLFLTATEDYIPINNVVHLHSYYVSSIFFFNKLESNNRKNLLNY